MTKLPDDAERAIRQLDDDDDDADPEMVWAYREPYRSRLLALLSSFREVLAFKALRRYGVLEHFAPSKRKRGRKSDLIDYAVDDVRRLKSIWPRRRRDDLVTIELIAAERHRRLVNHCCTMDKLDHSYKVELQDFIDKIRNRLRRGTTGGERYRRAKLRAK